jgi:hypothetical protein
VAASLDLDRKLILTFLRGKTKHGLTDRTMRLVLEIVEKQNELKQPKIQ